MLGTPHPIRFICRMQSFIVVLKLNTLVTVNHISKYTQNLSTTE